MNELALFAGAGGGILGGHLLGWRTVCAVEWEPYAAGVLVARQNDGILPAFPVWDDVQTFDGIPWRGLVDVVSGGFPCQDISAAGGGLELTAPGPACGSRWPELSVRFDPDSSSWKTAHCLWEEALPWYSVTLPRWGMTRNGHVFQHPTAERPISETVYGLWPTPVKSDALVPFGFATMERKEKGESRPSGAKIGSQLTWDRRSLPYVVDGMINPILHQWLMEWPLGWTSLQPLEMARFHEWQQQHSPSFPESKEAA